MTRSAGAVVQEALRQFASRDYDAFLEVLHPDIEWHPSSSVVAPGATMLPTYRGRAGIKRWLKTIDESFEEYAPEAREIEDLGEDRALVSAMVTVRRPGGQRTTSEVVWIVTAEDGKLRRMRSYADLEEARRSAGLGGEAA
jgi:ketosteroid isomerase-like protein